MSKNVIKLNKKNSLIFLWQKRYQLHFDNGVFDADNLDPIFKDNGKRIPLTGEEKIILLRL
ncbi:hypothetical protein [Flavobacterium pectinovorum]|uniref:hypothetical protein n=1 Tax=Flavobacterium pectinovorum TaxID=29533 RepID=UPI00112C9860|nr:hypothetical protein [Flavobacterium pectinovorum]